MNKFLAFLLLSTLTLFGSNILSYNIYDRTDRVDVMLTFDVPYHGKILKSKADRKIILKLYDAKIESTKIKHLSSRFLKTLTINPMEGFTQIVASVPTNDIVLKASKTADAYGLRLRFVKKSTLDNVAQIKRQAIQANEQNEKIFPNLPTKQDQNISSNYYTVIIILILAIVVMLVIKNKMNKTQSSATHPSSSWLFKNSTPKAPKVAIKENAPKSTPSKADNGVTIRFQKQLDERNSVVMIDFQEFSYLLLIGQSNNILLDRFKENTPTSQDEFESLLQEKSDKLSEFLQIEPKKQTEFDDSSEDILKIFSKKASNTPYDEQ